MLSGARRWGIRGAEHEGASKLQPRPLRLAVPTSDAGDGKDHGQEPDSAGGQSMARLHAGRLMKGRQARCRLALDGLK